MLQAEVNGKALSVDLNGIETIGDLLQLMEVHVPPRDVVVALRINGGECDSGAASQVRALPIVGVERIEVDSCSPEQFAGDTRTRVADYLTVIRAKFARAVECFEKDSDGEGLDYYRVGIEELRELIVLWDKLQQIDHRTLESEARLKSDLQSTCDRLMTAQDRNDLAAVRIVLTERLLPLIDRWCAELSPAE